MKQGSVRQLALIVFAGLIGMAAWNVASVASAAPVVVPDDEGDGGGGGGDVETPEPSSMALLGLGLGSMALGLKKKASKE